MKKLLFLSTKPMMFWVEVPPIILLIPTVIFNNRVNTMMRLYPLMIALSALIIFFAFYLFRAVLLSKKQIKCIGAFSSKEIAKIEPQRTLVLTVLKRGRLKIEIFGMNDDGNSSYRWLKNDEPVEINLFRATVNGGLKTAKKITDYFDGDKVSISEEENEGIKSIRIHFE